MNIKDQAASFYGKVIGSSCFYIKQNCQNNCQSLSVGVSIKKLRFLATKDNERIIKKRESNAKQMVQLVSFVQNCQNNCQSRSVGVFN